MLSRRAARIIPGQTCSALMVHLRGGGTSPGGYRKWVGFPLPFTAKATGVRLRQQPRRSGRARAGLPEAGEPSLPASPSEKKRALASAPPIPFSSPQTVKRPAEANHGVSAAAAPAGPQRALQRALTAARWWCQRARERGRSPESYGAAREQKPLGPSVPWRAYGRPGAASPPARLVSSADGEAGGAKKT